MRVRLTSAAQGSFDSMSTYSEKLKDPRWQKKRLDVFRRDGFACRDCGSTTRTLHVHHCHYEKGDPWNTGEEFLLTLCESCHEYRGAIENNARKLLGVVFAQSACAKDDGELLHVAVSLEMMVKTPCFSVVGTEELIELWEKANGVPKRK